MPFRRAVHDVRAAVAPVTPLLLDHFFHTGGGTWVSLAGFTGSLAGNGGPYRTHAAALAEGRAPRGPSHRGSRRPASRPSSVGA